MAIVYRNELSKNAMGGTELMAIELEKRLDKTLQDKFNIVVSRVEDLDTSKKNIYWCHDLAEDPAVNHLANGGYNHFERIVFVSNWQMQAYIEKFSIPWYKCVVLKNAINPIPIHEKPVDKVNFIYHTTPHRGLNILYPVFAKLCDKYDDIELDVYSSFGIYGWGDRDLEFKEVFDSCKEHPKINYHGHVTNDTIHKALQKAHIYGYPSIWKETSCISLIEAMSAGILCVHPNYGGLYETAANWTWMYQYQQNPRDHAGVLYMMLDSAVQAIKNGEVTNRLYNQKEYVDMFYNWELRGMEWKHFLMSLK